MQELLSNGGPLTWLTMVWGAVLYVAMFREVLLKRSRYVAALYSGAAGLVIMGFAATAAGLVSAGGVEPGVFPAVASVAAIPTAVATVLAAPAVVIIGVTVAMRR